MAVPKQEKVPCLGLSPQLWDSAESNHVTHDINSVGCASYLVRTQLDIFKMYFVTVAPVNKLFQEQ